MGTIWTRLNFSFFLKCLIEMILLFEGQTQFQVASFEIGVVFTSNLLSKLAGFLQISFFCSFKIIKDVMLNWIFLETYRINSQQNRIITQKISMSMLGPGIRVGQFLITLAMYLDPLFKTIKYLFAILYFSITDHKKK